MINEDKWQDAVARSPVLQGRHIHRSILWVKNINQMSNSHHLHTPTRAHVIHVPPVSVTTTLENVQKHACTHTEPEEKHKKRYGLSVNMEKEDHENSAVWGLLGD